MIYLRWQGLEVLRDLLARFLVEFLVLVLVWLLDDFLMLQWLVGFLAMGLLVGLTMTLKLGGS